MTTFTRIAALAAGLVLATGAASAQSVTRTIDVEVKPYELASSAGRTAVLDRIERAASRLCTPEILADRARMKVCRTDNIERMVRQTGSPLLLAQSKRDAAVRTAARD